MYYKKITIYFIIFTIFLLCEGCSWTERFVIINDANFDIVITYEIDGQKLYPIFNGQFELYKTRNQTEVDWQNKIKVIDQDGEPSTIRLKMPPKSILVFGRLSNDNYKKYSQRFINGYAFNLKNLTIEKERETIKIPANKFDDFFKKTGTMVEFVVK